MARTKGKDVRATYDSLRKILECFGFGWFSYQEFLDSNYSNKYNKGKFKMRLVRLKNSNWLDTTNNWQKLLDEDKIKKPGLRSSSRFFKLSKKVSKYLREFGTLENPKGSIVQDIKIKIAMQKGLLSQSEIIRFLETQGHEKEIEIGGNPDIDCGSSRRESW